MEPVFTLFTYCWIHNYSSVLPLICRAGAIKQHECERLCKSIVLLVSLDQGMSDQNRPFCSGKKCKLLDLKTTHMVHACVHMTKSKHLWIWALNKQAVLSCIIKHSTLSGPEQFTESSQQIPLLLCALSELHAFMSQSASFLSVCMGRAVFLWHWSFILVTGLLQAQLVNCLVD